MQLHDLISNSLTWRLHFPTSAIYAKETTVQTTLGLELLKETSDLDINQMTRYLMQNS